MASEILGLFDTQSPRQLRNKALDSMLISPTQMGSQGLLQQVVSMGQNAGTMIGMGAGSLLGGKVAGEVEAAYLDEAIKAGNAVKGTPAQKMKAVADALADKPGMGKQYLMALNESRKLEAEDLTLADAKFKAANRTKDFYVKVTKVDSNGQRYETTEKQTFRWSKENNRWEPFEGSPNTPSAGGGEATGGGDGDKEREAKLAALARMRAGIGEGPNQNQAESERLLGKKPPAPRVPEAPFSGSGIQGAEPEAIPSPNEQPMTFPSATQQPASPVQMTPQQMQQAGIPAAMVKEVVDYQTLVDTVKRMQQAGADTTAIQRELSLRYKRLKDLGLVK